MIRRILHPSDFSRASAPAFATALRMAKANRAELRLVHVLDPVVPIGGDIVSPPTYERLRKSAHAYGRKRLARLVARARKAGVRATGILREGVAWSEILSATRRPRTDLIVMGTHGRTGLSRMLLGSVAGRVIRLSRCPVLSVRPKH
jgi:nucleotide-binding universal stress UspA family protein